MKTLAAILSAVAILAAAELIYPDTMQVTAIENDVVTLETSTGFVYEMSGAEDYMTGDLVSVLMFSNGTTTVTDDVIISARYSGYWID